MSIPEQVGKVSTAAVSAMASTPLAIALLIVNVAFLAFAGYVLGEVAANSAERNKSQTELIAKLVGDIRDCRQAPQQRTSIEHLLPKEFELLWPK